MSSAAPSVLLVSRSMPCHVRGGLEFHVLDLSRALAAEGAEVHLLTAEMPADYRRILERTALILHEIPRVAPERYSLAYMWKVRGAIQRVLARRSIEIVHGQEFSLGLWRPRAGSRQKVILTVHGSLTSETPLHPDLWLTLNPEQRRRALRRYGRRLLFAPIWGRQLDRADLLLVDSRFTQAELRRVRPGVLPRVRRVPLGVDLARFPEIDKAEARRRLGWPADSLAEPRLLTLGRVEWQKGHETALRALGLLKEMSWRYTIAGEGKHLDEVRRIADELGLAARVDFEGRVDEERKRLLLAAADLFLWPERTHPAFGLVGLEAMLMNTPLLGTDRGAIAELVYTSNGWLAPPDQPSALADVLRPLLAEPGILAARALDLRARMIERYTAAAMARATMETYREALAKPNAR